MQTFRIAEALKHLFFWYEEFILAQEADESDTRNDWMLTKIQQKKPESATSHSSRKLSSMNLSDH